MFTIIDWTMGLSKWIIDDSLFEQQTHKKVINTKSTLEIPTKLSNARLKCNKKDSTIFCTSFVRIVNTNNLLLFVQKQIESVDINRRQKVHSSKKSISKCNI